MKNFGFLMRCGLVLIAVLLLAGTVQGQQRQGNVFGIAMDQDGAPLPGVTVQVTGIGAPRIQVTAADGSFRFPGMDPGSYQLTAKLEGFSIISYPDVIVRIGANTTLELTLVTAVEEVITVTSESPLLDDRKISKGTTVSQIELEKIPTARDPWSIVTQSPGVVSDRVNVGGSESGQQAVFMGPGATSDDENTFAVDGVIITDMAAIGSSPTYYDFDQFEEMQVTTGGSDVTTVTGGVTLNMVTKRGSNQPRGSGRYMLTDGQNELFGLFKPGTSNNTAELAPGQSEISPNEINEIVDYGFEAGGPIIQDKMWAWGSYGRNDVKTFASGGAADNTLLENSAVKLNGQLAPSNSIVASWNRGDKIKAGRGAGINRAPATLWDQTGPTEIWKIEDTQVVGSNLFVTGLYSYVDGGFALLARGGQGPGAPDSVIDFAGVWQSNFISGGDDRNSETFQVDGSYFFDMGPTNNELKFGGSFRQFEVISNFSHTGGTGWGGQDLIMISYSSGNWSEWTDGNYFGVSNPNLPSGDLYLIQAQRAGLPAQEQDYVSFWVQDTLTMGNLTANFGFRYDKQDGVNSANNSDAQPAFGTLMPAVSFGGNTGGFDWTTITPRLGLTYALGEESKTLLRMSYSQYAEQLSSANISRLDPTSAAYGYFFHVDTNGDTQYQQGEPTSHIPSYAVGWDPAGDPNAPPTSPNRNDPNVDAPVTQELLLGVEHALLPEFVVGATFTYRKADDLLETFTLIQNPDGSERIVSVNDYIYGGQVTGNLPGKGNGLTGAAYDEPYYILNPSLSRTGGSLFTNGDSSMEYTGFGMNFTKRLANRWMARGYLQYGDAEYQLGSFSRAHNNPTNLEGSDKDGELWAIQSGGSGNRGDVWLQSTWSWNLNGMYQVAPDAPWGFNVAANLFGREGYPLPYYHNSSGGNVQVTNDLDSIRAPDVFTTDLRLEKDMPFGESLSGTISLDIFNLFNENYVVQRERRLDRSSANNLRETLAPRVYRLGFRLSWR